MSTETSERSIHSIHPSEAAAIRSRPSSILGAGHTFGSVTDKISALVLTRKTPRAWYIGFALSFLLVMALLYALGTLFAIGVGIWGINNPVGWGFDIINFVWWIGIGHAGTLISAILLLLRQEWRTSINRFAEAMTLFAVACAGIFPLVHTGRPWLAYWLFPYPNTMGMWPQPRSPLLWDVFAVTTYATVSFLFWFVGLIPDFATMRDRAKSRFVKIVYGFFAMGWRGSARHWHRYQTAYLLLAGLATPLVLSVHTIVSFDFAVSLIPGWHATIFPPYFVAGAIYAGFAMVLTLAIPLRMVYGLEDFITMRHLRNMGKVMLATGLIVAYGYMMETFMAWYSGNQYEQYMITNRLRGPYAAIYWALMICNVVVPQLLWLRRFRHSVLALWVIAMFVNVGMWLERFVIIVTSLHRDFLPSSWGMYYPTQFDWMTFIGTIGLFLMLMFLFVRLLPVISIFEMRELVEKKAGGHGLEPSPAVAD
ncbi:MAG: NrfD/PsrC family molybdoenzyme membrane anchor subunit [Acidobacteriota bacterium]|nr:polysulfide reductase NrfD [Blastocatellia bacterium]MDW8238571.1 NrfD/PsrC family molybdoenzyme membrane anchor subunit [Acidobacteriota bacterium]